MSLPVNFSLEKRSYCANTAMQVWPLHHSLLLCRTHHLRLLEVREEALKQLLALLQAALGGRDHALEQGSA